ncbi:MAG: hypothetical protein DYG96_05925 [Chlorobi bacterium CHB2]|nr:hypothetical protein [Chlorobi bacterium CHB2]
MAATRHQPMMLRHAVFLLWLLPLVLVGCREEPSHNSAKPDTARLIKNLPSGRFQLPTIHTPAPDFWITLPPGYQVKFVGRMPSDEFYIFRSDDPTLADSTAVSPGFLRIYMGTIAQSGVDRNTQFTEASAQLMGYRTRWREWKEPTQSGKAFYAAEIAASDFFQTTFPNLKKAPLFLHIYAGGTDTAHVAALMAAAATLTTTP